MSAGLLGSVAVAVLVGASFGIGDAAQLRSSLSGSWQTADQRQSLRITQSAAQLSLSKRVGTLEHRLVYQLDGSLSRNETSTVTGEKWSHASRARWVGSALVVTTTTTRASTGGSWDWMATYFLNADGQLSVATLDSILTSDQAMDLRTVVFNRQ